MIAKSASFDDIFSSGNDFFHRNEMDKAIEAYSQAIKLKMPLPQGRLLFGGNNHLFGSGIG